ncbi:hypothetical protein JOB18_045625 [Solea senegalensis]|uniref:Uncharacterized protein n=1 Tax=Solea senegalensis TaxID=28829 RepID=A0AAV6STQ7_SOLSE|nr:hypothetical protein JOB18_045625 [Solea senegalensis]
MSENQKAASMETHQTTAWWTRGLAAGRRVFRPRPQQPTFRSDALTDLDSDSCRLTMTTASRVQQICP